MAEERKGRLYLVRHGEASYTSSDYDQISSLGVKQAQALGRWFANRGEHFSKIVTGSMLNCSPKCMVQGAGGVLINHLKELI